MITEDERWREQFSDEKDDSREEPAPRGWYSCHTEFS